MPDRAIIPLLPALALGFICGIIASALLLSDVGTLVVGLVGAVGTAIAAGSSVFGVRAEGGEKAIVAGLRIALAIGLFASIYLFILGFLRNGKPASALIWLVLAFAFALIITRLCVRERPESGESDAQAES
jgi:hypothetical protein